jgi:CRP-like cAMP-binding protein
MKRENKGIDNFINELIYNSICRFSYIPKEVWQELPEDFFSILNLEMGDFFVKENRPVYNFGFVVEGILKEYYITKDGNEYIKSFSLHGDFTGSYFDLLSGLPSTCNIRALKPTKLAVANFKDLQIYFDKNIHWQRLGRMLAEKLFIIKARREYELLTLSAEERYKKLIHEWTGVETELSQILIASYLGITPISLSRIKKKIKERINLKGNESVQPIMVPKGEG